MSSASVPSAMRGSHRTNRRMLFLPGITATHAISFEAKTPVVAKFDSSRADNQWSISAHTLRRLMDHFGPKVELLDINTEGEGVLNLTCSTEKQYSKTDGKHAGCSSVDIRIGRLTFWIQASST